MKNFHQNLLITVALALCGLCAWQWHEQTVQRDTIGTLNGIVYQKNSEIQNDAHSMAVLNHQIEQMDASITEIKAEAATNELLVLSQKREISKLEFDNLNLTNEVAQYQQAVDTLQAKLKEVIADINKQNETIANLVTQRDDLVNKYNGCVKDRNDVVAKYNDLVHQAQKQSGGQK